MAVPTSRSPSTRQGKANVRQPEWARCHGRTRMWLYNGFCGSSGVWTHWDRNRLCLSLTRRTRLDRRNSRFHRTSEREQRFRVARRSALAARSDQETTGIEDMIRRPKGRTGGLAASSPGGASEGDPEMAVPGSAKSLDWRSRILLRCLRVGTAPNDIQSQ